MPYWPIDKLKNNPAIMDKIKNPIPLAICPRYIWPKPVTKNERAAANTGFFLPIFVLLSRK